MQTLSDNKFLNMLIRNLEKNLSSLTCFYRTDLRSENKCRNDQKSLFEIISEFEKLLKIIFINKK